MTGAGRGKKIEKGRIKTKDKDQQGTGCGEKEQQRRNKVPKKSNLLLLNLIPQSP